MNYSVAEFRKNIRLALDAVERGEDVHITRHNKTFAIIKADFNYLTTDKVSSNIRPDIKNTPVATQQLPDGSTAIVIPVGVEKETTPPSENEFAEALDAAEQECCRANAPCKHWAWDPVRMMYVNSLSGRGKVEDE